MTIAPLLRLRDSQKPDLAFGNPGDRNDAWIAGDHESIGVSRPQNLLCHGLSVGTETPWGKRGVHSGPGVEKCGDI